MREIALILALITVLPVLWRPVLGQEPSTREKGVVKKPNGKTGTDQSRKNDQRGTKELPLVVDAEGHQKTETDKNKAAEKEDRVREVERWTLYFAQLTAWATVGLVFIGFGGVIAAVWTLRQIKRQADLTQASLILTFPPKLTVRNMILHRENPVFQMPWCIEFTVANIGGGRADVVESAFDSNVFEDGPPPLLLYTSGGGEPNIWNVTLMPGEEKTFFVNIEDEDLIGHFANYGTRDPSGTVQQRSRFLYFFGYAKYQTDKMTDRQEGIMRSIRVLRHYDLRKGRFVIVDDTDYEYGDQSQSPA